MIRKPVKHKIFIFFLRIKWALSFYKDTAVRYHKVRGYLAMKDELVRLEALRLKIERERDGLNNNDGVTCEAQISLLKWLLGEKDE